MSKEREALKLALEALEYIHAGANNQGPHTGISWRCVSDKAEPAITAIKEALADNALDRMAENARELGLDYEPIVEKVEDSVGMGHKAWDMVDPNEIAKAFHEALAEPPCKTGSQCTNKCQQCEHKEEKPMHPEIRKMWEEYFDKCFAAFAEDHKKFLAQPAQQQEPFGYFKAEPFGWTDCAETDEGAVALYERPPASKPWVGLEKQDMPDGEDPMYDDPRFIAGMVWANNKLLEKNA